MMEMENHSLWFARLLPFHHGLSWVFVLVTSLVLLYAPPSVAAQTEFPPPPPPGPYPFDSKVKVSPTMAIILACLISAFFVMGCVSVYVRQYFEHRLAIRFALEADGVDPGRRTRLRAARGLDPAVVDAFPTFMYSEVKGLKIGNVSLECAVCLSEFEDDETLRLLPKCSHVFHPDCIDAWLSSHITCPVCRANLVPKPGETRPFTFLSHDPDSGFSPEIHEPDPQNSNSGNVVDDSIVNIPSPEVNQNGPPRSTPRKERIAGKLRRSYTTGHAVVKPGENCERFTLRLPEEVRNRLVNSSSLSRTKSCVAFPRARSSRKGYRSGSGSGRRSDRLVFMATPPFFSNAGSGGSREESTSTPKTLLKTVTSPLHRMFKRTESNKDNVNDGERSFDRLKLDDQV